MYQGKDKISEIKWDLDDRISKLIVDKFKTDDFYSFGELSKKAKDKSPDNYQTQLSVFKYLFSLSEEARTFIWNHSIDFYNLKDDELPPKEDFTNEEYAFILEIHKAFINAAKQGIQDDYLDDINKEFSTERLVLRPFSVMNRLDLINYFSKNISEFLAFYQFNNLLDSSLYTQLGRIIRIYWKDNVNLRFSIYSKSSNDFLGYVELQEFGANEYNLCYFIFSPFRKKGYASEAVKALINKALKDELYINSITLRDGIYKPEKVHVSKIYGKVKKTNIPSIKILEKLGFKEEKDPNSPKVLSPNNDELLLTLSNHSL